jgi:hypothetical protein
MLQKVVVDRIVEFQHVVALRFSFLDQVMVVGSVMGVEQNDFIVFIRLLVFDLAPVFLQCKVFALCIFQ